MTPDAPAEGVTFKPWILELEPGRSITWLGRTLLPDLFDGHHTLSVAPIEGGAAEGNAASVAEEPGGEQR